MTDTDTLRPEVREALDKLRACVLRCDPRLDPRVATIRAELLRLADIETEHARWREYHRWNIEHTSNGLVVCRGEHDKGEKCAEERFVPIERAESAEAELDALKNLQYELAAQVTRADRAEAELAALRARIAEAPFVSVRVDDDKHVSLGARSHPKDFAHLHGRRARLVREDGDD